MFGFSLPKLIFTALLVVAVVYGFRMIGRIGAGGTAAKVNASPEPTAEETQKCSVCGTYLAADNPTACERADCPYKA